MRGPRLAPGLSAGIRCCGREGGDDLDLASPRPIVFRVLLAVFSVLALAANGSAEEHLNIANELPQPDADDTVSSHRGCPLRKLAVHVGELLVNMGRRRELPTGDGVRANSSP